jgi:hypothetical protein
MRLSSLVVLGTALGACAHAAPSTSQRSAFERSPIVGSASTTAEPTRGALRQQADAPPGDDLVAHR